MVAVWCVSDVDVDNNTPDAQKSKNIQLNEYTKMANEHGFKIALSNPCFELWFLLHFEYTAGYIDDYDAVEKKLLAHLPNYKKNGDIFGIIVDRQASAIDYAKKLKRYHEVELERTDLYNVSVNPYTNVWELVESLT